MNVVEIANTTKGIFQNRKIADMQNFVAETRKVIIMEFQLCTMIVAMILKKRSDDLSIRLF